MKTTGVTGCLWSALSVPLFLLGLGGSAAIAAQGEAEPRVRSEDPRLAAAITQGIATSPTFRQLLQDIASTDGLIYVQAEQCRGGVPACLPLWVGAAGSHRFLRVLVNPRKAHGCRLVSLIAHELKHALEVLTESRVSNGMEMFALFERKGSRGWRYSFETKEAIQTGMRVERETCRS